MLQFIIKIVIINHKCLLANCLITVQRAELYGMSPMYSICAHIVHVSYKIHHLNIKQYKNYADACILYGCTCNVYVRLFVFKWFGAPCNQMQQLFWC